MEWDPRSADVSTGGGWVEVPAIRRQLNAANAYPA
jgi:hypothetical protein